MPPRIFISYRRDDAAGDAGRLADHLSRRFGKERIFLDVDTIQPGTDFVQVLHTSLAQTAAVLVVIGPRWLSVSGPDGARRLDSASDFVRLEVEAALQRTVPVVPVLVQGAKMPRADELPASLAALATRQAVTLDNDEFHDDAERLCDRLAPEIGLGAAGPSVTLRRWWPVAALAALVAIGLSYYAATRGTDPAANPPAAAGRDRATESAVNELVATAAAQQRRNQDLEALATLQQARALAPDSGTVREAQEAVAMDWIRNVHVTDGKSSFGEAIKPALDIVDAALPSATGSQRADLLAHTGWATFLLWRDGDRRLDPGDAYRQALAIDPQNPFANAMLAHWTLFQDPHAVTKATQLFDVAVRSGRALEAVRLMQWAAYTNADSDPDAVAARLRVANAMRVNGEHLDDRQTSTLWSPYYFALTPSHASERAALLDALTPDDHTATLNWAFGESATRDTSRQQTLRFYLALLHAKAGQTDEATTELRALEQELVKARSGGSLLDAVRAALTSAAPRRR